MLILHINSQGSFVILEHGWSGTSLPAVTRRQACRVWPSSSRMQPDASPAGMKINASPEGMKINEMACDISTKQTKRTEAAARSKF